MAWCLQVWKVGKVCKKSGSVKVGQEDCKKSGNFTNISKKFGGKKRTQKIFSFSFSSALLCIAQCVSSKCAFVCVCVCVCMCVCVLTQCAKSGHYACSTHAKCGPSTKSGHTRGPRLILASDLDASSLKTQELTIKLWGSLSPLLAYKLFLEPFYIRIKIRSWLKSHTFQ